MNHPNGLTCHRCGAQDWKPTTFTDSVTVAGQEYRFTEQAFACQECGEVLIPGEEVDRTDRELIGFIARGPAGGDALRRLRKYLGLKAKDVAALLDVSPVTISRWENGHHPVDEAPFRLLALAALENLEGRRDTLELLESRRVEPGPTIERRA